MSRNPTTNRPKKSRDRPKWKMPDWMEPYRDAFQNTGGNRIEELMNDTDTNGFNNSIRSVLIISVESQITLLSRIRQAGALTEDSRRIIWDSDTNKWVRKQ